MIPDNERPCPSCNYWYSHSKTCPVRLRLYENDVTTPEYAKQFTTATEKSSSVIEGYESIKGAARLVTRAYKKAFRALW